ncbi:peptidoglycan-binding domain-containing protein [Streptomyces sp. NPDC001634]|uniref:peptidoglycan-binding domain-containing protein n=1 Tax=Streptomyces sp. NPDC001634 TaxID=3154390 RepID=UPI00332F1C10
MNGSNGQACPECAAPRRPDGTPSCGCARRASDALRDARTAEAAAAEDFDPLRIRPYVELGVTATEADAARTTAPDETMRLTAVSEEAERSTSGSADRSTPEGAERSTPEGAERSTPEGAERSTPERAERSTPEGAHRFTAAPDGNERSAKDADETVRIAASAGETAPLGVADETTPLAAVPGGPAAPPHSDDEPPRRRRRTVLLAVGGAVVTVVAAAGLASGLFTYNPPERDGALPEDIRASVPEVSSPKPTSAPPSTAFAAAPTTRAAPSLPKASPSPSAPASSASPAPPASATPSQPPTTVRATGTLSATPGNGQAKRSVQVLRLGDQGPEVTELQQRLREVGLYAGPVNGSYDSQVESAVRNYQFTRGITQDDPGVYGAETREKLESETNQS